MSSALTDLEKCTGAMLASAIGDALGWPNESRANNVEKGSKKYDSFVEWTRHCRGNNWHYEKIFPGEYSDDTQMILAVSRSIIAGNWENIFANNELPYWLEYQRGGGRALLKAANSCKKGKLLWETINAREYFNAGGNGTVMRIMPHVIAGSKKSTLNKVISEVIKDSIITHGHPRAILGATCYAYALDYLLKKETVLEYGELITAVIEGQSVWGAFPDKEMFKNWIDVAVRVTNSQYLDEWNSVLTHMLEQLHYISLALKKGLMVDDFEVLTKLECFGKANGAGDVAILAAIYFTSKYANNPVLGIKTPAYLAGIDTDTIASITGGLLGMLCGRKWIPLEWKMVQDYDCFIKIAEILLSDDMAKCAKGTVINVKRKYKDWENTPIGKMHLLNTFVVTQNKKVTVVISKWESTLGQTLYFKEYQQEKSEYRRQGNKVETIQNNDFSLEDTKQVIFNANDVIYLQRVSELQKISFKKIMKIIERLLRTDEDGFLIAKQMKVDRSIVELLKQYIRH